MINTHSSFLYGFDVTASNQYLDLVIASQNYSVAIQVGSYSAKELLTEIENTLNAVGTSLTFTVSMNRSTRIVTISADGSFDLLVNTGDNAASGIYSLLGVSTASNFTSVTSVSGVTSVGTLYQTQFKLQDFVDQEDNRMSRFATVNKAASGKTTVISFGTDRVFEFSFKFLTDKTHASGPIRNQANALSNIRNLMRHCVQKKPLEFMPDEDTPNTYYRVILDSTSDSSDGTSYKIQEQYGRNLIGYYELNGCKFRIIED